MNRQFDDRLTKVSLTARKQKEEVRPEAIEGRLLNSLDCLEKEEQTLVSEIKLLKRKVGTRTSSERVIELEKKLKENIRSNELLARDIKNKTYKLSQDDKKIICLAAKTALPPQVEVLSHLIIIIIRLGRKIVEMDREGTREAK